MGSFYGNVTLLGTTIEKVAEVSPRPAFVFAEGDDVVVFAAADDEGAPTSGSALSAALACVAFSAGVHDDDIFFFEIHDGGRLVTGGAVPDPGDYFGLDAEMLADLDPAMLEAAGIEAAPPVGPIDSAAVVDAVGRGDPDALGVALESDFVFASERHRAVVDALGLPGGAVGWGFRYLTSDAESYSGPELSQL